MKLVTVTVLLLFIVSNASFADQLSLDSLKDRYSIGAGIVFRDWSSTHSDSHQVATIGHQINVDYHWNAYVSSSLVLNHMDFDSDRPTPYTASGRRNYKINRNDAHIQLTGYYPNRKFGLFITSGIGYFNHNSREYSREDEVKLFSDKESGLKYNYGYGVRWKGRAASLSLAFISDNTDDYGYQNHSTEVQIKIFI